MHVPRQLTRARHNLHLVMGIALVVCGLTMLMRG